MTATRQIVRLGSLAGLLAGLLAGAASARAGETVIFSGSAPEAAELARILWPGKGQAQGAAGGATRSIRINADSAPAAPAPRAPSGQDYAAAEPVTASDAGNAEAPQADAFGFLIHFAYDSTEILPQSRPYLDSVGAMLRLPEAQGRKVTIVGHTDARGSEQYNQVLSERRAAAVRDYLTREFGVAADRLQTRGEGETDPLDSANPYDPDNRRVEFKAG
jgi:outer membrane protein OmpA-like peptidoglycan-associated protein